MVGSGGSGTESDRTIPRKHTPGRPKNWLKTGFEMNNRQTTAEILMVRPANFGFNPETAGSNAFQTRDEKANALAVAQMAQSEFDQFVAGLRREGVLVWVEDDTALPVKPDAIFPNNWLTMHEEGRVVTYPMLSAMRRLERRKDIVNRLGEKFGMEEWVHLEHFEASNQILEGTGSLVLDRTHRIAYACLSPRTDEALLDSFCEKLGYEKMAFRAVDGHGQAIYHTNVLMAMGESFVVICLDAIRDAGEKTSLLKKFELTKKEVIEISLQQMGAYAGNMLQVRRVRGRRLLVMSEQAFKSLTNNQLELIGRHTDIFHSPIATIEKYGGGSARCMMAEIFLPEKK
jgi:hypothetical protein